MSDDVLILGGETRGGFLRIQWKHPASVEQPGIGCGTTALALWGLLPIPRGGGVNATGHHKVLATKAKESTGITRDLTTHHGQLAVGLASTAPQAVSAVTNRTSVGIREESSHMTRVFLSAPVVLSLLLAAGSGCAQSPEQPVPNQRATAAPGQYETTTGAVVLPKGEPRAGRQAFLDLKCTICHRVPQDQDLPAAVSRSQGPDLDHTLRLRPTSELAAAIILPSHSMSLKTSDDVKKHLEGVLSPMGDFSDVMTVRQLADLLAYLQSLEAVR